MAMIQTKSYNKSLPPLPKEILEGAIAEALEQRQPLKAKKYRNDPVAFAKEVLKANPAPYQEEILASISRERRVAVRGPHGLGKTALAAWVVLWFISVFDECKVPTTASAWRQLTKFLWPEIHKWSRKADWLKVGQAPDLLALSARRNANCEAFAVASDKPDLIEGAHAEHLLYVFDEAKAIPDVIWDAAEGAFSSGDCYALAISTPGDRAGRFYEIHRHAAGFEHWFSRHVTLEEAIAAKRISAEWAEQMLRQWGEMSPVYQARVLGEFPEHASDALISLGWVELAREVEQEPKGNPVGGLDIARYGEDSSAKIMMDGNCAMFCDVWEGHDTMASAGRAQSEDRIFLNVDEIGIGSGVVDRLKEIGYPHRGVNVSEAANDSEHFQNLRAELYWNLRERFQGGEMDLTRLEKRHYDRLCGELTAIRFKYTSKGQIAIEPKEDMKKRLGRSPDLAEALMLACAPRSMGIGLGAANMPRESRWIRKEEPRERQEKELGHPAHIQGNSRWRR